MSYDAPNYTQVPNKFFDEQLAEIDSVSELKVTLTVIRQTRGFHQDEKWLTVSRLMTLTGLSKPSVVDGVKRALKRGTITRKQVDGKNYFSMAVKNLNPGGKESLPEPVKNLNPRKESIRKETSKETPTGGAGASTPGTFCQYLREELDGADVPLLKGREDRYGKEFKQHLAKGVTEDALYKACDRIVERWTGDDHRKLTVAHAFEDVVNGKPPKHASQLFSVPESKKGGEFYTDPDTGKVRKKKDYSYLFGETA